MGRLLNLKEKEIVCVVSFRPDYGESYLRNTKQIGANLDLIPLYSFHSYLRKPNLFD